MCPLFNVCETCPRIIKINNFLKSARKRGKMNKKKDDFVQNIFYLNDPSDIKDLEKILKAVESCGYALIRGLFDRAEMRTKLKNLRDILPMQTMLPSAGVPPESIRKNSVKWSIGCQSGSQFGIQRLMMTVYNPLFEFDFLDMHSTFIRLITLRDSLAKRQHTLLDKNLPSPKFNATRLQIYPSGGGFMSSHIDTRAIDNASDISPDYIQLVLLLTEKGEDYKIGGAFVERADGSWIDSEENSLSGDVVVYNGSTKHGVADIDPHINFDPKSYLGRVVALATIYN